MKPDTGWMVPHHLDSGWLSWGLMISVRPDHLYCSHTHTQENVFTMVFNWAVQQFGWSLFILRPSAGLLKVLRSLETQLVPQWKRSECLGLRNTVRTTYRSSGSGLCGCFNLWWSAGTRNRCRRKNKSIYYHTLLQINLPSSAVSVQGTVNDGSNLLQCEQTSTRCQRTLSQNPTRFFCDWRRKISSHLLSWCWTDGSTREQQEEEFCGRRILSNNKWW